LESKQTKTVQAPKPDPKYPLNVPESQGDLADRANVEIDQEIQERILQARQKNKETKLNRRPL
jgi:hypothetical protein